MGCYFRLGAVKENNGKKHISQNEGIQGKWEKNYAYVYQFAEYYEEILRLRVNTNIVKMESGLIIELMNIPKLRTTFIND